MKSHGIIRKHMKSMKIMKIDEIAASWDRAKVSIGAGPRCHRRPQAATRCQTSDPGTPAKTTEIHEIHEISWNHMKSHEIHEIHENHENRWNSSQLGSSKGFYRGSVSAPQGATGFQTSAIEIPEIHEISWNPRKSMKSMKIYENRWISSMSRW